MLIKGIAKQIRGIRIGRRTCVDSVCYHWSYCVGKRRGCCGDVCEREGLEAIGHFVVL